MNLVVGGCGYIGSGLVYKLLDQNKDVIVIDNLTTGFRNSIPKDVKLYDIDIDNDLTEIFDNNEIDTVFHLAEKSSVKESMINPKLYLDDNISGSINLINTCKRYNIKNFVYSSSAAVYGNAKSFKENDIKNPINPYGLAKSYIEEYLKYSGLKYYCMRYFNACGADFKSRYGERHDPETHLIPIVIDKILSNNEITVYGNRYNTPDGTCVRDYVHIDDINNSHINIINNPPGVYNIGSGIGYSILEIIDSIGRNTGITPKITFGREREGDPDILIADNKKLKDSGIIIQHNLDDIIKSAILFYKKIIQISSLLV